MPERRRPGLWKTLVAAAQTAIDRVADGVDALADGVEALADGLRSLARGVPPPRTARRSTARGGRPGPRGLRRRARSGVVLVRDAPDTGARCGRRSTVSAMRTRHPRPGSGASPGERRAAPAIRRAAALARAARRGAPSAAELPGGRPLPPRIVFRRRQDRAGCPAPVPYHRRADSASVPPWRRSAPGAGCRARARRRRRRSERRRQSEAPGRHPPAAARRQAPPAAASPDAEREPAGSGASRRRRHAIRRTRSDRDAASAPFPAVAFADPLRVRQRHPRAVRPEPRQRSGRPPFDADRRPSARPRAPAPPVFAAPRERSGARRPSRDPPAPPRSAPQRARREPTRPPPPRRRPLRGPSCRRRRWSAPAGDAGGALAWAAASASDVLVDEQRST